MKIPRNPGWLLVGALLLGGCGGGGGSGGGAADPATAFAGSWTFNDGMVTPMCSGVTIPAVALSGNTATITKIDADHVALNFSNAELTCGINFTVSQSTATAEPAQTCTISVMGTMVPVAITSWTMTLAGGTSISMSMTGTANLFIVSCTPSGTGTLLRLSSL